MREAIEFQLKKNDIKFLEEYKSRFKEFRNFEFFCLERTNNATIADEAWRLLSDLEHSFAAKIYSGCFVLTCAMIEIHLRKVLDLRASGLKQLLIKVGLFKEHEWLVKLRNDIMHGNPNDLIHYFYNSDNQSELDKKCFHAFLLLHTIAAKTMK